jgi:protein tyrosine phosphatase (PTP) superfamily phosphohydrolase (DUF442 family)
MHAHIADTGGPVIVTVNIFLRSISKIDDVNMARSHSHSFNMSHVAYCRSTARSSHSANNGKTPDWPMDNGTISRYSYNLGSKCPAIAAASRA